MSKSSVLSGQMDSAESCWPEVCDESAARACAACVGDDGADVADMLGEPVPPSSRRRRLIASACLLGGPRLRLGLSKVHGMSRAVHARHGGPDLSHCRSQDKATGCYDLMEDRPSLCGCCKSHKLYAFY